MSEPAPIDELLAEAAVLEDLDAARAEAWASGLLSDWLDHDDLLASLAATTDPAALAVAVALTPMLPAAADVVDALLAAGLALPAFAPHVGTARAIGAWTISDPHGAGTSVVVEYEHDDEVRHDMLVELDGDVAVDLLVGPSGVIEAAQDESARRFTIEAVTPEVALARIRAGLQLVLDGADVPLTDAYYLNHALVAARLGLPIGLPEPSGDELAGRPTRAADPEGDALARTTLVAALARHALPPPAAEDVVAAADAWRAARARDDEDAVALGIEIGGSADRSDVELLLRLAAAYVGPGPRAGMAPAAADAIDGLEWADWLGAVLPLVRAGAGADASPEQLVRNINRCPEITTSIPKRDAPAVASAFACAEHAWRHAGAIDDAQRLTGLGAWLLPHALALAWGAAPGTL